MHVCMSFAIDHKNISLLKVCDVILNVCDVKHITTYTNQYTIRSQMVRIAKKAPKGAYFHQGSPQSYKKISGKTKLKYDKRLKRTPMITRKNNVAKRESNDNIDHKNVVII